MYIPNLMLVCVNSTINKYIHTTYEFSGGQGVKFKANNMHLAQSIAHSKSFIFLKSN